LVLALGIAGTFFACSSTDQGVASSENSAQTEEALGSTGLVISQVYGGGSDTNPYKADFVELFNRGTAPASLNGLSIQYANVAKLFSGVVALPDKVLQPGQYFLVQMNTAKTGTDLPVTPDFIASPTVDLGGTQGKIALVNGTTKITTCGGSDDAGLEAGVGRCPAGTWIDMVGYGAASDYEGSAPATAPTAPSAASPTTPSTGLVRKGGGCTDTDDNLADFDSSALPVPRNWTSNQAPCSASDAGTDAAADAVVTDAAADVVVKDATADAVVTDAAADVVVKDATADAVVTDAAADVIVVIDAGNDVVVTDAAADVVVTDAAADVVVTDSAADAIAKDAAADVVDSGTAVDSATDTGSATDSGKADTGTAVDSSTDTGTAADSAADTGSATDSGKADADSGAKDAGKDAGKVTNPVVAEEDDGCGCRVAGSNTSKSEAGLFAALFLAGAAIIRRRRSA